MLGSCPRGGHQATSSKGLKGRQAEPFVESRDDKSKALIKQIAKPVVVRVYKRDPFEKLTSLEGS
jgi:hypothetical protein